MAQPSAIGGGGRAGTRSRVWLGLVLVLALALGLRVYQLGAQSLWNDEGTSVALALRDLATIARDASRDIHPPLYYDMLHVWVRLFGAGEAAVRSLSVLAGVGLVLGTWLYARRRGHQGAALVAAALSALSAFQVYYSQEARMYAWVALWGLLSMLALQRLLEALRTGQHRLMWALLYAAPTLAALYTHYFAVTLVLAQNLAFVLYLLKDARGPARERLWRWTLLQALILLAYAPWLLYSRAALQSWPAVSAPLSWDQVLDLARAFALGITVPARLRTLAAALALWAVALLGIPGPRTEGRDARPGWLLDLLYLAVPLGTLLLLSLRRPMLNPKFVLLATPAFYVLLGRGVVRLADWLAGLFRGRSGQPGPRRALIVLITLLAAAPSIYALHNLYTAPAYQRDDYRAILAYVRATAKPDDALLVNAPGQMDTVSYYDDGSLATYPLPQQRPLDRAATEAALQALTSEHARIYGIFWGTDESDPERVIEGWLDQHCFKTLDSWFGNVRLVVYAVPQQAPDEIAMPYEATLGEQVRLRGYTLLTPTPASGDILQLGLYWQTNGAITQRFKVFVHLLDAHGNIVAQRDSEPAGGSRPTSDWSVDETIADYYGLWIQPGTPPGRHSLRIGLYDPDTGQRLTVAQGGQTLGDVLTLTDVTVGRAPAPPPLAALDLQRAHDVCWPSQCLIGHSLHRLGFEHESALLLRPGDAARLLLFWRTECTAVAPTYIVALEQRRGQIVWEQMLTTGSEPGAPCAPGDILRCVHALGLPADLAPGLYRLTLRADGQAAADAHLLQQVRLQ